MNIIAFFTKAMGFMADGSINFVYPVLSFLAISLILGLGSYTIIRRTELR